MNATQVHELEGEVVVRTSDTKPDHQLSLLSKIFVERGTMDDWKQMQALHYKSGSLGVGPRIMRCVIDHDNGTSELIGAQVFTTPKPLDSGRNEVFPNLKPNRNGLDTTLVNTMRMKWINRNLILSSRLVLDTMYRGAGVAYRFKNIAGRMMQFRFVEGRSSMSRFNPFAVKSGARSVAPRHATALEHGLLFFSRNFTSPAYDYTAILQELEAMPEHVRSRVMDDMRSFYFDHSSMEKSGDKRLMGMTRIEGLPTSYLLKQVMQLVFGATVYSVWQNPDHGVELPARIPLTAFDNQGPSEPLRLDLLP